MDNQLTQAISVEVNELIYNHIGEMQTYVNYPNLQDMQPPETIIALFGRLAEICSEAPETVSFDRYLDAQDCLSEIKSFLKVFNCDIDAEFEATKAGQLLASSTDWCRKAAKHSQISLDDVWDTISPVMPDHLEQIGENTFEAKWWSPVPIMDVEILQRTEGVIILSAPGEPEDLPGGLSIQFALSLGDGSED